MSLSPNRVETPCDPVVQQARQDRLEALYVLDGRDCHGHELHGLYTGLAHLYSEAE